MKKKVYSLTIVLFILMQFVLPSLREVYAVVEDENVLLISSGVTVNKNSTLDEVIKQYGREPVLTTPSPIGGTINSFVKEDYTDYLYIETDADGNIIGAGAASDDFKSQFLNIGDPYGNGYVNKLQGYGIYSSKKGYVGVVTYNKDKISTAKFEEYKKNYKNDYEYEKNICKHAVVLSNYFYKMNENVKYFLKFDDEVYDALAKMEDSGVEIEDYCVQNNKSLYMDIANYSYGYKAAYEALPNPFRIASNTMRYTPTINKNNAYFRFTIEDDNESARIWTSYIDKSILNELKSVDLTDDEIQKYNAAKQMYNQSLNEFNSNGESLYTENPQYKQTPLVAGKIYENKLIGAVDFVNMIRVAAGFPTLEYDANLSDIAQHKSVLVLYTNNFSGVTVYNPHLPPQAPGVTDEFYARAMELMTGENLYSGSLISSITNAINDGYGDKVQCGHRYNLLHPGWAKMGIGTVAGQSTHRFYGSRSYPSISAVCWPQIGITPTEAYSGGYWTCKFYKGYAITENSSAEVKCLNNGYKYTFINGDSNFTHNCVITPNQNMISFFDSDIEGKDGLVYEITIKNVENTTTHATEDFTYRTAFKNVNKEPIHAVYPSGVTLDKTNVEVTRGEKVILNRTVEGEGATEVITKYTSSNPNVAKVNQYGIVETLRAGTATIKVETLNGHEANCVVKVNKAPGDPEYPIGDLDRNGYITANDAAVALDMYKNNNATDEDLKIGDLDNNKIINANDAALILDMYKNGK